MPEAARQLDFGYPAPAVSPRIVSGVEYASISELPTPSHLTDDNSRRQWRIRQCKRIKARADRGEVRLNRAAGCWEISTTCRAEWLDGKSVAELLTSAPPEPAIPTPTTPPPGWGDASDRQKRRAVAKDTAAKQWAALRREFPGTVDADLLAIFNERHGADLAAVGIKTWSVTTLYRWRRNAKQNAGNIDGRGQGRNAEPPGSRAFRHRLVETYFVTLRAPKHGFKTAFEIAAGEALERGEPVPGVGRTQRWFKRRYPEFIRKYHRHPERWQRECLESVRRDYDDYRPNQLWVGDHHRFDFVCRHNGKLYRPWLTAWEDMKSRVLVGHCITLNPDSDTISGAYRVGVERYGFPLGVMTDRGLDYLSDSFRMLCDQNGVELHRCIPRNPGAKPPESMFKTVCKRFSELLPSWIGNKPENRPEKVYADIREGKIEVLTLDQVRDWFALWVDGCYHERTHSGDGMNDRTPFEVFADNPVAKRTAPTHVLDFLLLKPIRVKVTRRGVRWNGIYYGGHCPDLHDWQGKDVLLKVDPADASTVEVADTDGRRICTVREDRLTGSSAEDIKQLKRARKAARRRCKSAVEDATRATQPLSMQAMIQAQARYVAHERGRKAAGAESLEGRPLALLPGASRIADSLPPASSPGRGETEFVHPLDMPTERYEPDPADVPVNPLDWDFGTPSSAESDRVEDNPLDALPDVAAADDEGEWVNPLDVL